MPIINIETVKQRSSSSKMEILKAVHDFAAEVLKIPSTACHVRWIQINKDDYYCVTEIPDNHIYIEIKLFAGRSMEIKKQLYQGLFSTLKNHNIDTSDLMIALNEIPKENWGMNGGLPCNELSFNYKTDI